MGDFLFHLFFGLAQFFSGLFPERFTDAARTGPTWRRVMIRAFIGLGSIVVGLAVAALVFAVGLAVVAVVMVIFE